MTTDQILANLLAANEIIFAENGGNSLISYGHGFPDSQGFACLDANGNWIDEDTGEPLPQNLLSLGVRIETEYMYPEVDLFGAGMPDSECAAVAGKMLENADGEASLYCGIEFRQRQPGADIEVIKYAEVSSETMPEAWSRKIATIGEAAFMDQEYFKRIISEVAERDTDNPDREIIAPAFSAH